MEVVVDEYHTGTTAGAQKKLLIYYLALLGWFRMLDCIF